MKLYSKVIDILSNLKNKKANIDETYTDNETDSDSELPMILYFATSGSLEGRNTLLDYVSSPFIDCTGGQCACEDGDLQQFGDELVKGARETGYKIYHIYRMQDPGLGLDIDRELVKKELKSGFYQSYKVPDDVLAT